MKLPVCVKHNVCSVTGNSTEIFLVIMVCCILLLFLLFRFDPDSKLHRDLVKYGKHRSDNFIELNIMFSVSLVTFFFFFFLRCMDHSTPCFLMLNAHCATQRLNCPSSLLCASSYGMTSPIVLKPLADIRHVWFEVIS